ncbi:retrotrans gag domain-containing protein [Citrus sinensis]|nr:retrotrans gag domain-containing protein [Citrus sinensis]
MSAFTEGSAVGTNFSPLLRSMKMDIPKFNGSDPTGWDFCINKFFDLHGTPDNLRLRIASFHMEGRVAAWYQWMKANNLLTTWQSFFVNLKNRFGASMYKDHQGNLSKLTQTSTATDFQSAFEELMNNVTGISEPLLISFFITGLKPDIRRELLFTRPTSLMEAFALARAYEARSDEVKTTSRSCANHHCRSKFLLLMGTDDEECDPGEDMNVIEQTEKVVTADISCLNALAGQSNPRSLNVLGEINEHQFHVLIDSGSTYNFIKPQLAERVGLSIQSTSAFRVYIGNGDFLVCRFHCLEVPIVIQGHEFCLDFFVLPIEGPEVVLGIQWLQRLGRVSTDYSEMTME